MGRSRLALMDKERFGWRFVGGWSSWDNMHTLIFRRLLARNVDFIYSILIE